MQWTSNEIAQIINNYSNCQEKFQGIAENRLKQKRQKLKKKLNFHLNKKVRQMQWNSTLENG